MAAPTKLKEQIDLTTSQIQGLEEAQRVRQVEIAKLQAEQRSLAVAAQVRKDPEAREAIGQIVAKLSALRTEGDSDAFAVAELSVRLQTEKATWEREQWVLRCRAVRSLIDGRIRGKIDERVEKAADELRDALTEAAASDRAIAAEVGKLAPAPVASNARPVSELFERRRDLTSCRLRRVLESPLSSRWMDVMEGQSARAISIEQFQNLLREIDGFTVSEAFASGAAIPVAS